MVGYFYCFRYRLYKKEINWMPLTHLSILDSIQDSLYFNLLSGLLFIALISVIYQDLSAIEA